MKILLVGFPDACKSDQPLREVASVAEKNGAEWIMADSIVQEPEKKLKHTHQFLKKIRSLTPDRFARYMKILRNYLKDSPVDAVVCVNPSGESLMENSSVPCYTLMTDYSPQYLSGDWDGYFVPHDDIRKKLLSDGIPDEKIHTIGMPLSESFGERIGKEKARKYMGIPIHRHHYLLSSEGLTAYQLAALCQFIAQKESRNYTIGILVSREEKQTIADQLPDNKNIQMIIPSRKLNIIMEASDVLIARPLGIISAEAAAAGVPLVHIASEDSVEKENADFFASREMSMKASSLEDAVIKAKRLVDSQPLSDRMRSRQKRNSLTGATQKLVHTLLRRDKKG